VRPPHRAPVATKIPRRTSPFVAYPWRKPGEDGASLPSIETAPKAPGPAPYRPLAECPRRMRPIRDVPTPSIHHKGPGVRGCNHIGSHPGDEPPPPHASKNPGWL